MLTTEVALMTASRLRCARSCQRMHKFKYELGYRPVVTVEAMRFGILVHTGLEAWWLAIRDELPEIALSAAFGALDSKSDPFDLVKAQELLRGYHCRWSQEPYEVLGVEVQFETEMRNPETGRTSRRHKLAGKIDAIVRDRRDGRVLIVEHKTAAGDISMGSEYWRRLRMDGQISIYYEGARSLGHDVAGCLYDVIGKPGLKPLKATPLEARKFKANGELYANQRAMDETPEQYRARLVEDIAADPNGYFQRGEVVRLEAEMDEAMFDVWQLGQQIREAKLAGRHPRNPDACVQFGRTCAFFPVCSGEASIDDPTKFVRSDVVHPELEPKEEACQ